MTIAALPMVEAIEGMSSTCQPESQIYGHSVQAYTFQRYFP
jgi:hypothetical protein